MKRKRRRRRTINQEATVPFYSEDWTEATRCLYDEGMGCENMGPMLYQIVRFTKARKILEVGAGFTTIFLLQALNDNMREVDRVQRRLRERSEWPRLNWIVEDYVNRNFNFGVLRSIDNLDHDKTTAHLTQEVAERLGLSDHLELVNEDAFEYGERLAAEGEEDGELDLLWVDFGDGDHLERFFASFW